MTQWGAQYNDPLLNWEQNLSLPTHATLEHRGPPLVRCAQERRMLLVSPVSYHRGCGSLHTTADVPEEMRTLRQPCLAEELSRKYRPKRQTRTLPLPIRPVPLQVPYVGQGNREETLMRHPVLHLLPCHIVCSHTFRVFPHVGRRRTVEHAHEWAGGATTCVAKR